MRQQGYAVVDNGAPCLTEVEARAAGLPLDYARRSVVEMDTLHCRHCGGVVIKNPDRTRERGHCLACGWYVCDSCAYLATLPDYVHETFLAKVERVKSQAANFTCT
jgi:hypothetical protein